MKNKLFKVLVILIFSFSSTGCLVRTYTTTKERVDQDISGNQGCLQGECPSLERKEKSSTREIAVMEIELKSPMKFGFGKGKPKVPKEKTQDKDTDGNLGYLTGTPDESLEKDIVQRGQVEDKLFLEEAGGQQSFTEYKIKNGDTLQKISKKFYGTYSKWMQIYNANKDKIKDPDNISPGEILNIPQE